MSNISSMARLTINDHHNDHNDDHNDHRNHLVNDSDYIQHTNWIHKLRAEYNYRTSLIENNDLVNFKKEWNIENKPPLIKRSSPCNLRSSNYK